MPETPPPKRKSGKSNRRKRLAVPPIATKAIFTKEIPSRYLAIDQMTDKARVKLAVHLKNIFPKVPDLHAYIDEVETIIMNLRRKDLPKWSDDRKPSFRLYQTYRPIRKTMRKLEMVMVKPGDLEDKGD